MAAKDKSIQNWRCYLGTFNSGRHVIEVPLPVTKMTVVAVSASEFGDYEGKPFIEAYSEARQVGDANVWVSCISTHGTAGQGDGMVTFALNIDGEHQSLEILADITRLHADQSALGVISNFDIRVVER